MGDLVRLRTAHGAGSRESCTHDHIAVDASAREVECAACGALLDPFAVLDRFARDGTLLRKMYVEKFELEAELVALLRKVTQTRERIAR